MVQPSARLDRMSAITACSASLGMRVGPVVGKVEAVGDGPDPLPVSAFDGHCGPGPLAGEVPLHFRRAGQHD